MRQSVEALFGKPLAVHSDFVALSESIFDKTREHVSETTIERVWNYSTRRYDTVSKRTLDVLARYVGFKDWGEFTGHLKLEGKVESDMFDKEIVDTGSLEPGSRLRIGWPPDRVCVIRYLGDNRFVAEETFNSKLRPGDTFSCLQFRLHAPLYLAELRDAAGEIKGLSYGVGLRNGLTILQLLP